MFTNSALIGFSGFVGANIQAQLPHAHLFNTQNISSIRQRSFDYLTISATPSEKWKSNKFPVEDKQHIDRLWGHLKTVTVERVFLISTIDVYGDTSAGDENTIIDQSVSHSYGLHRHEFEKMVQSEFKTHVIRLPGLYGRGLKKNIIFDYLNNNEVEKIDTRHQFQFYNLNRIGKDMLAIFEHDIPLINMVTEPVLAAEVKNICTSDSSENIVADKIVSYNMKSIHALKLGGLDGYLSDKSEVIQGITQFAGNQR